MSRPCPSPALASQVVQDAILAAVADGTVLVGTAAALAQGLGATAVDFPAGLRGLRATERIAVTTEPRGQLTIRLEPRPSASSPPPVQRPRPKARALALLPS